MTLLVDLLNERLAAAERECDRLRADNARLREEIAASRDLVASLHQVVEAESVESVPASAIRAFIKIRDMRCSRLADDV